MKTEQEQRIVDLFHEWIRLAVKVGYGVSTGLAARSVEEIERIEFQAKERSSK